MYFLLFCPVFARHHPTAVNRTEARRTAHRASTTCSLGSRPSNSFALTPLSDPHPLTPVASILYKNIGGGCFRCRIFTKSFVCNTYGPSRKCCKHRTYRDIKSFRCNTYKKQGVGSVIVNQESDEDSYSERPSGVEGPLFIPDGGIWPE